METVTSVLELLGLLLIVAAASVAVGMFTVLALPGALLVGGVGLVIVSFVVTAIGARR